MKFPEIPNRRFFLPALCLVFLVGAFLRLPMSVFSESGSLAQLNALHPAAGFQRIGPDEALYRGYVNYFLLRGQLLSGSGRTLRGSTAQSADGNSAAYTFSLHLRGIPVAWDFWHRRSWLASPRFQSVQYIALGHGCRVRRAAGWLAHRPLRHGSDGLCANTNPHGSARPD